MERRGESEDENHSDRGSRKGAKDAKNFNGCIPNPPLRSWRPGGSPFSRCCKQGSRGDAEGAGRRRENEGGNHFGEGSRKGAKDAKSAKKFNGCITNPPLRPWRPGGSLSSGLCKVRFTRRRGGRGGRREMLGMIRAGLGQVSAVGHLSASRAPPRPPRLREKPWRSHFANPFCASRNRDQLLLDQFEQPVHLLGGEAVGKARDVLNRRRLR